MKYDVIRNPAKQSSGDPAFMLRTTEGWPVGLFWSEQYAMQFAAVLNQSIGRADRSSHPVGEPEPGEVDPDEPTPLADPEPDTGDPVALRQRMADPAYTPTVAEAAPRSRGVHGGDV